MSMMILIHQFWWFIEHLLFLSFLIVYVAVGARVLTYSVVNRVPLKIAPNIGEWAMQSLFSFFLWPVGLMVQPELQPALRPMNRRDRDRLAMRREQANTTDAVKFATEKMAHRIEMDKLHAQLQEVELAATHKAIAAASTSDDEDEDEGEEEGEVVEETEPPSLGKAAQEMLAKAQYAQNPTRYYEVWGIKLAAYPYQGSVLRMKGCYHPNVPELIECPICSPVHRPNLSPSRRAER